jgi:WD40 repeat protein
MKKLMLIVLLLMASSSLFSQLEVVWQKTFPEYINFAKFSPDGKYIYCAVGTTIKKMDALSGEYISSFKNDNVSGIYDLKLSNLGNMIVTHNGGGGINLWDTRSESCIFSLFYDVRNIDISPNEKYLIFSTSRPMLNVVIWDIEKKSVVYQRDIPGYPIKMKYSNDGQMFALGYPYQKWNPNGGYDNYVKLELWDAEKLQLIRVLQDTLGSTSGYYGFDFSTKDQYLAILGSVYSINLITYIYNISNGDVIEMTDKSKSNYNFRFTKNDTKIYYYGKKQLELQKQTGEKYFYTVSDKTMETGGNENQWYVLMGFEKGFTLLKSSITSVNDESDVPYLIVNYSLDGIIRLKCSYEVEPPLELTICDLEGKIIYNSNEADLNSTKEMNFKVSLPNGTYIIKAKTRNRIYTQKFQVLR